MQQQEKAISEVISEFKRLKRQIKHLKTSNANLKRQIEIAKTFVPAKVKPISTRAAAIKELRRLLKNRTYIWSCEGIEVKAAWESDVSISIDVDYHIISPKREKQIVTIEKMQADSAQFQMDIDRICKIADILAKKAGENSCVYFEELLAIAEK